MSYFEWLLSAKKVMFIYYCLWLICEKQHARQGILPTHMNILLSTSSSSEKEKETT